MSSITRPFAAALYLGREKPSDVAEYIRDLIEEVRKLVRDGIELRGIKHNVRIHSFICDSPARAMLKCIKHHNGFYSCERCTVRGEKFHGITQFLCDGNEEKRTDSRFARFEYSGKDEDDVWMVSEGNRVREPTDSAARWSRLMPPSGMPRASAALTPVRNV